MPDTQSPVRARIADVAERVRAAIAALHYVPRAATRSPVSSRISGSFFPAQSRGIEAGAWGNGFGLLIYCTQAGAPDPHRRGRPIGLLSTELVIRRSCGCG